MPLRYPANHAAQYARTAFHPTASRPRARVRCFHAAPSRQDDGRRNHYEILNVSPDASPTEIKKSFYELSKTHHPDHNPFDPSASKRFMRISEAYGVLGRADKRAKYDRDVLGRDTHAAAHERARKGSYHSTNPAGGRPPSGLSRRRGTFTGPPPSFFRSGGWGGHSEKRQAAHEESTGGGSGAGAGPWTSTGTGQWGGMGPGQDPYGHREDVPHFDREGHERTGQAGDERRAQQRARKQSLEGQDMGVAQGFFLISGILVIAIVAPLLVLGGWWRTEPPERKKKRRDAS